VRTQKSTILRWHRDLLFKRKGIIAHSHSQGEELLEGFFGIPKVLNDDPARRELNTGREILEFLSDHRGWRLNKNLRLPCSFPNLLENGAQSLSPALLVIGGIAIRQMAKMLDNFVAVSESIFAGRSAHERRKNLLRPAATDAQSSLKGCAIDPREGKRLELFNHFIEAAIPERFVGHRACGRR
jgi:hypothetical protein